MNLKAVTNDFKEVTFKSELRYFSPKEKFQRGLKNFLIFFFAALFCILIPILHFVLVPAFILFAVYRFIKIQGESGEIPEVVFSCPNCNKIISIKNITLHFPRKEYCPECRSSFKINTV